MTVNKNSVMMRELERCRELVDVRLGEHFSEDVSYKTLLESMRYSLLSGGKRIRALLCLNFCAAVGGDLDAALDAACAIEMLHTYSLIHDDLPCMDDDDMRRGKPSNHIKYGECTAVLAGDALQAAAFETVLKSNLPPERVVAMARVLAEAAGPHGICGGQHLDIFGDGKTVEALSEIHKLKTAALFVASAKLGVYAGGGSSEQLTAAVEYASALGLAFQVRDDVLDDTALAAILGREESARLIREETEKAVSAIDGKFEDAEFLVWLAQLLQDREV